MLVEELQTFLAAAPTLVTLLGTPSSRSDSTNGLFPIQALDGPALSVPYLVYSQTDGEALAETMTGTMPLRQAHFMLSCYGATAKQAIVLANTVENVMLAVPPNAVLTTQGIWLRRRADDSISIGKGTLYGVHLTFLIIFNQTS